MGISAISTDWGPFPRIVRIVTSDTFYTITQPGYLTAQASFIQAINNGLFDWQLYDLAYIQYGNGSGFFNVDYTVNDNFSPLAGNPLVANYAKVPVSLAAFLAQYATPVPILAAIPNQVIQVQNWALEWIYGSAALVGGGAMSLQFNSTAHAGGIICSNTIAAADFTGVGAGGGYEYSAGGLCPIEPFANIVDVGIYLSNPTAAFTGGTGGSAFVHVWYGSIILP